MTKPTKGRKREKKIKKVTLSPEEWKTVTLGVPRLRDELERVIGIRLERKVWQWIDEQAEDEHNLDAEVIERIVWTAWYEEQKRGEG